MATAVLHPFRARPSSVEVLRSPDARLTEAVALTEALSVHVAHAELIKLTRTNPATLIGRGAVERLKDSFNDLEIELVVVDHTLTPVQQRNLEQEWGVKVIDRTGLILEIFGARANTAEGKLQVELAALDYQRSRLVKSWTHLERQRGGFGFLGGPGESQLEIDRRLIEERMAKIKRDLEKVRQTRALQRDSRARNQTPVVALVGYTNAGKSSLFNAMTTAEVLAKDMLFATLDPTMRQLKLPAGRLVVLSDTVGFISSLPHQLVAAFRATLEELEHADVILHVRDISSNESAAQCKDVEETLVAIGIDVHSDPRIINVLNKIDLLQADERPVAAVHQGHQTVGVSAVTGEGVARLKQLIEQQLSHQCEVLLVTLKPEQGEAMAWLFAHGDVLDQQHSEEAIRLRVSLSPSDAGRYLAKFGAAAGVLV